MNNLARQCLVAAFAESKGTVDRVLGPRRGHRGHRRMNPDESAGQRITLVVDLEPGYPLDVIAAEVILRVVEVLRVEGIDATRVAIEIRCTASLW